MLGVLSRFYDQASGEMHRLERIELPRGHLVDLSQAEPPADVVDVVGTALLSAGVLGRRTAELHGALASDRSDPAFAPEPLPSAELAGLAGRLRDFAHKTFRALRDALDRLDAPARDLAARVLEEGPGLV
jgi:maltose alpha-D-glucosyltransferase/alpha-amylase